MVNKEKLRQNFAAHLACGHPFFSNTRFKQTAILAHVCNLRTEGTEHSEAARQQSFLLFVSFKLLVDSVKTLLPC